MRTEYDRSPSVEIEGQIAVGGAEILEDLRHRIPAGKDYTLVLECYPGTEEQPLIELLQQLQPTLLVKAEDCLRSRQELDLMTRGIVTEDRVFGTMYCGDLKDFYEEEKLAAAADAVRRTSGLRIVCGVGASLICEGDLLVYADVTRWEIQLRARRGMKSLLADNADEDPLRKFKRGYFLEWRIADRLKEQLLDRIDLYLDDSLSGSPRMIAGSLLRSALAEISQRPFRTVPYFDVSVWGGTWMEEKFGLPHQAHNYGWCFDGVPEENSLQIKVQGEILQMPAMNLVLCQPKELLGEKTYARFGAEYPIRFDMLDTMNGQNLSFQVHPTAEYIRRQFGMAYTQDESYYILDAKEDGCVYIGIHEGTDPKEMIAALNAAQQGGAPFDADRFSNRIPVRRHDHVLIPAGTCHCAGRNTMTLEISATPYIFTFKLWDWGRLGLDGRPRPVNVERGSHVIQWNRTTDWVRKNLVNHITPLQENAAARHERTGLHELEFVETERIWLHGREEFDTRGTLRMLNVVEGAEAVVESPEQKFAPMHVHYAETFILPAAAGRYTIRPAEGTAQAAVICASVRGTEEEQ